MSGQLIRSLWLRVTSSLHLSAFILSGVSPKSLFVLDLWHSSKTKWQWQWAWAIAHPFSMNCAQTAGADGRRTTEDQSGHGHPAAQHHQGHTAAGFASIASALAPSHRYVGIKWRQWWGVVPSWHPPGASQHAHPHAHTAPDVAPAPRCHLRQHSPLHRPISARRPARGAPPPSLSPFLIPPCSRKLPSD